MSRCFGFQPFAALIIEFQSPLSFDVSYGCAISLFKEAQAILHTYTVFIRRMYVRACVYVISIVFTIILLAIVVVVVRQRLIIIVNDEGGCRRLGREYKGEAFDARSYYYVFFFFISIPSKPIITFHILLTYSYTGNTRARTWMIIFNSQYKYYRVNIHGVRMTTI